MDPLTQGVLGALATQALPLSTKNFRTATVVGFISGMAADMDVFIDSAHDPLLFLEFHRHFTHSLAFIPAGALLCALFFKLIFYRDFSFKKLYLYSFAGYATHALLDACTSYGTQLWWPFSNARVAWHYIAIIDPLFTLPLLAVIMWCLRKKTSPPARWAWVYALAYISFGALQLHRAQSALRNLAQSAGHVVEKMEVKATLGNNLVWRSVYQSGGQYYIYSLRVSPLSGALSVRGSSQIKALELNEFPAEFWSTTQGQDLKRFEWFSAGFLARHPADPLVIGDVRYALRTDSNLPLWGIRLKPEKPQEHVGYENFRRDPGPAFKNLWADILDR